MKKDFEHNLIKGRIAEKVFELMMIDSGKFTVIPFGYENTVHELLHYQHIREQKKAVRRVKKSPDFVVISKTEKKVHLVEVKYQSEFRKNYVLQEAKEIQELWDPCWLFIATLDGFYLDFVANIIKKEGEMNRLTEEKVSADYQKKYLELLRDFEP